MADFVSGKALLVIRRNEDSFGERRYDVDVYIQHVTGYGKAFDNDDFRNAAEEWAREEFGFIEYELRPAPPRCQEMEVGDTMRFAVSFISHSWVDYWGEGDSDLDYTARLLRHQKFTDNRKRVKRYRLYLKQHAKREALAANKEAA